MVALWLSDYGLASLRTKHAVPESSFRESLMFATVLAEICWDVVPRKEGSRYVATQEELRLPK